MTGSRKKDASAKRRERNLRKSENRLKKLIENADAKLQAPHLGCVFPGIATVTEWMTTDFAPHQ